MKTIDYSLHPDPMARKPQIYGAPGRLYLSDGTIDGFFINRRIGVTARCWLPPGYRPLRLRLDADEFDALRRAQVKRLTIHLNGVAYWCELRHILRRGRPVTSAGEWSFPIHCLYPIACDRYPTEGGR